MPDAQGHSDVFVAVPSYNHARFVEQCLRSIFAQTLAPAKLFVIDDGSSDGSVKVIERVLADSPVETEFISRPNRGLSATLNEALRKADTPYFAYLGSDDVWLPGFLASRASRLSEDARAPLAFGDAYLIDDDGRITDCTADWPSYPRAATLDGLLEGSIPVTSSVVFRTAEVERFGWNEASILEDYELYLRLAARAPFAGCGDRLALWRKHGDNVSNDAVLMLDEWIAAQNNAAGDIGLAPAELAERQERLRFLSAASVLRGGDRNKAAELVFGNRRGAASVGEFVSMAARLALPRPVRRHLEDKRRQRQIDRYRAIELPVPNV